MKNKKHIAMRCNQEQFETIKPKLERAGEIGALRGAFIKYKYLTNNFGPKMGCFDFIGNDSYWEAEHGNNIHEEWNEKIFLEACGIETIPTLEEVKEYFKDAKTIQDHSGDIGFPEFNKFEFTHLRTGIVQNIDKKNWLVLWTENQGYAKILTYKTPKFEITKEQILELYNTGNPQPTIRKMFPEVFEKLNGWASDSLRINKNWLGYYENSILKYGLDSEGQWFVSELKSKFEECKTNIKATPEEITEALKKEAVRRGFVGKDLKILLNNKEYHLESEIGRFQLIGNILFYQGAPILCNGIWAKIIPTKTIQEAEELLKELGHEIKIVS